MLREFVVNLLGTEDGADCRAVFLRLMEKAAHEVRRKAPGSAGNCADTSRPVVASNQPDALP